MNLKFIIVLVLTGCLIACTKKISPPSSSTIPSSGMLTKTYKQIDTIQLDMAIHYPETFKKGHPLPAIIFFFGGGWNGGTIEHFRSQAEYFASRGIIAVRADYRVKSRHNASPFECLKDAKSAIRYLRKNATELGIDPDQIIASGGSAGGHLAAATALIEDYNEVGEDSSIDCKPNALVLFNPVIDNGPEGYGYERIGAAYRKFSPHHNIKKNMPPTIFFLGGKDALIPVNTAKVFQRKMGKIGSRCDLHIYDKQPHGFFNKQFEYYYRATLYEADRFLSDLGYLQGEPTLQPFDQAKDIYLFSYFVDNGEDGLHLLYSDDALHWYPINRNRSILTPTVGKDKLMRDPCIIQGPDGTFHMVYTTSWSDRIIGYAHSKDLIKWSKQKALPVMEKEEKAMNCWAPEISYDAEKDQFLIYWSSTILGKFPETENSGEHGKKRNHRIYATTTKDFEKLSPTTLFYEPGFNVIDASIQQDGDQFLLFIKDETLYPEAEKNIRLATAKNIIGPYSQASAPITGDYWAEGPTAFKKEGQWHVIFDKYQLGEVGLVRSADLKNWEDISDQLVMPKGIRHGTIFKGNLTLLKDLVALNVNLSKKK